MLKVIVVCVSFIFSFSASAGEVVFEGYPHKKIEVTEQAVATYEITKSQASEYKVVIEREGDKYYWRTRNNLQLVPMQSGVYITFLAVNGAGYVRVLNDTSSCLALSKPSRIPLGLDKSSGQTRVHGTANRVHPTTMRLMFPRRFLTVFPYPECTGNRFSTAAFG